MKFLVYSVIIAQNECASEIGYFNSLGVKNETDTNQRKHKQILENPDWLFCKKIM